MYNAGIPQYIEVRKDVATMAGPCFIRCRAIFNKAQVDRITSETLRALKRAPRSKRAAIKARAMRRLNGAITVRVE